MKFFFQINHSYSVTQQIEQLTWLALLDTLTYFEHQLRHLIFAAGVLRYVMSHLRSWHYPPPCLSSLLNWRQPSLRHCPPCQSSWKLTLLLLALPPRSTGGSRTVLPTSSEQWHHYTIFVSYSVILHTRVVSWLFIILFIFSVEKKVIYIFNNQ